MTARLLRGRVVSFDGAGAEDGTTHIEDGAVLVRDGLIAAVGEWFALADPAIPTDDWSGRLVLPGFVDPHIHFPQAQATAAYGAQLLDWLKRHVFPEEARFADPAHGAAVAPRFYDELIRNGTTTACAFCSVHAASADAFFAEGERRGMRMLGGKVLMDRGAPAAVLDPEGGGIAETEALIGRWHGRGRLGYAISPRFAITSTPAQMEAAGALIAARPDLTVQTHLSENRAEIDHAVSLFPGARDYADIYARYGMLGPRSLMGHCVHLSARERAAMAEAGAVAVWCPTSNQFLGSGLFDLAGVEGAGVRAAVATDIGAGTTWGMLRTLGTAHDVAQLRGLSLAPSRAFRMATAGNAAALGLGDRIGRIAPGWEADIVVLDPAATPAMRLRAERVEGLEDLLFLLAVLGDDRAVAQTYVSGAPVKSSLP
jgi:guanine deaminase